MKSSYKEPFMPSGVYDRKKMVRKHTAEYWRRIPKNGQVTTILVMESNLTSALGIEGVHVHAVQGRREVELQTHYPNSEAPYKRHAFTKIKFRRSMSVYLSLHKEGYKPLMFRMHRIEAKIYRFYLERDQD